MTKSSRPLIAAFAALAVLGVLCVQAQEKAVMSETGSSVPELTAFHEIIYPIWHTAYPEKDVAALKSYVPKVNELAAKVYAAKLPPILHEKEAKWQAGLAEFRKAVDAYSAAAKGADDQAMLNAAEALHMRYEMLVRAIRPVLPEMDEFHKALYVVYHKDLPDKKWDEIGQAAPGLLSKAEAVAKAQLPKRYEAKSAEFQAASAALVEAARELAGTGHDGPALEKAVNKVHAKYEALSKLFE